MTKKRTKFYVLALAVFLLVVQSATYNIWAPESLGRVLLIASMGGYESLPPPFSYMVIEASAMNQLSARQREALRDTLRGQGTKLVNHRDELPDENKYYHSPDDGRQLLEYVDASQNSWDIGSRFPFYVCASYGNVRGSEGAWGTQGTFIWLFGKSVPIQVGYVVASEDRFSIPIFVRRVITTTYSDHASSSCSSFLSAKNDPRGHAGPHRCSRAPMSTHS